MKTTEKSHVGAARKRRFVAVFTISLLLLAAGFVESYFQANNQAPAVPPPQASQQDQPLALAELEKLEIKGRAPKTGYSREQFSTGWEEISLCGTRNRILKRDLADAVMDSAECNVLSGRLLDPYTGEEISFVRAQNASAIQIDHVVALSDAWQKGAQALDSEQRRNFYHDDLNLLAVDGPANMQKGDGDAATWLPPNKRFRCQYVARQIAVKAKYNLWVTDAEHAAIKRILATCPDQRLPSP